MREKQRNDRLGEFYEFRCKCKLCTCSTLQALSLESDTSFMYAVANVKTNDFNVNIIRSIIQHCNKFLVQHSHMFGSQEVHYSLD